MNKTTLIIISFLLYVCAFSSPSHAISNYNEAYNTCSPFAHSKARTQCNYGRNFENYYLQCMQANGFNDDEISGPEHYKNYLKAYEYCSSISDQKTKEFCNYGNLFNKNYNQCMATQGFNADGEAFEPSRNFEFDF